MSGTVFALTVVVLLMSRLLVVLYSDETYACPTCRTTDPGTTRRRLSVEALTASGGQSSRVCAPAKDRVGAVVADRSLQSRRSLELVGLGSPRLPARRSPFLADAQAPARLYNHRYRLERRG